MQPDQGVITETAARPGGDARLTTGLMGALADLLAAVPGAASIMLAGEVPAEEDERIAALLDDAAQAGARRGDGAFAVAAQTRAAQISATAADRVRRFATAACLAASMTGDFDRAESLLTAARSAGGDLAASAEAALAAAFLSLHGDGDAATARRLLRQAIMIADGEVTSIAEQAIDVLLSMCLLTASPEDRALLDRYLAKAGQSVPEADLYGNPRAALARLDSEIGSLSYRDEPAAIVRVAAAAFAFDRLPSCRQGLRRVGSDRLCGGAIHAVRANAMLGFEAFQTGQWDEADQRARTVVAECAERGYELLRHQAQGTVAFVAACRGEAETARGIADEIARWASPRDIGQLQDCARYAYVLAALAQADFNEAYRQAVRISPAGQFARWVTLDLVEAALRTDREIEAAARVDAVKAANIAAISPRLALITTAATAMTAPDDQAAGLFEEALAVPGSDRWPFDRARVHLLFGERLRRMRKVAEARGHLEAALEEFSRLGAPTWAARAAAELRATGQAPRRADRYDFAELTSQELEIARLAAVGLSNKQIGDRLFLSHRTVGAHLYRVFPKLGITSRAALSGALARAS
jgi:DNA-binding CsgD family transcriptional regulator